MGLTPRISFVVPCYNYGRFLGDCLDSIFSQETPHEFEVIVIDDASTDNTQEVIQRFNDRRLHVISHLKNQGHVISINEGFAYARGNYVARIDADDRYCSHFLSSTIPFLEKNPEFGMVYGQVSLITEKGEITLENSVVRPEGINPSSEFVALLKSNYICAPSAIARREVWAKGLPIPSGLSHSDWYLNLQIARNFKLYYVDKVIAHYRVHSSNLHSAIAKNRSEEETTFKLLDRFFSEQEVSEELERKKQASRSLVYATQYRASARRYFYFGMMEDARRCYLKVLAHFPTLFLSSPTELRFFLGSLIGKQTYDRAKRVIKKIGSW